MKEMAFSQGILGVQSRTMHCGRRGDSPGMIGVVTCIRFSQSTGEKERGFLPVWWENREVTPIGLDSFTRFR